jgi:hypothetical protein
MSGLVSHVSRQVWEVDCLPSESMGAVAKELDSASAHERVTAVALERRRGVGVFAVVVTPTRTLMPGDVVP